MRDKMKELINLLIAAIIGITAIEITALLVGYDGAAFGIAIAGISGIAGIGLDHFYKKSKLKRDTGNMRVSRLLINNRNYKR